MAATPTEQVLEFVRGRYPDVQIEPADDIFALGFVNSLFAMELVMFVENTFGLSIPNHELRLDNFRSADAMAALVARLAPAMAG